VFTSSWLILVFNEDNYLEHSLFEHYHQGYPYGHSFVADIPSKNVRVSVGVHKKEKNIVVTLKSVK